MLVGDSHLIYGGVVARFLLCTMPLTGHIRPGLPIARKLVERGHEVRWYTGRKFQPDVEATGARFEPLRNALDFDDGSLETVFPGITHRTGLDAFKYGAKRIFLDSAVGQFEDLRKILAEFCPDVLLSDMTLVGSLFVYEKGGPVRAVYAIWPLTISSRDTAPFSLGLPPSSSPAGRLRNCFLYWLFNSLLFRDVNAYYDRVRASVGLAPSRTGLLDDLASSHLYLQGTTSLFEYPRSDLPPQVHFVGPFLPGPIPDFVPPAWWGEMLEERRPVVHVTQGTATTETAQLIIPTLRALANEDVIVVATTGGKAVEGTNLGQLPSNALMEPFIPHCHLMPHVDVMVTNAGYGGVQIALANVVPLVVAGRTEEKPEVCKRVEWAGAGINLKTNRPSPYQIRQALRAILNNPQYRCNAERIQADIGRHDAPVEAAILLERLAATKQPVTASLDNAREEGGQRLKSHQYTG